MIRVIILVYSASTIYQNDCVCYSIAKLFRGLVVTGDCSW